jgi:hypothetical protein
VAGVGSFVDWRKELAFLAVKLKQMEKNVVSTNATLNELILSFLKCVVLRNGKHEEIH